MSIPAFAAIVAERSAVLPVAGRVSNYNGLVGEDGYVGIKTGSDGAAGGCLMFAKRVSVGGRRLTLLGVVLGQRHGSLIEAALSSARQLGDSAAAALRTITVLPAGADVLRVSGTTGQHSTAVTAQAVRAIGWPGLTLAIAVRPGKLPRTLRAGERVASVWVRGSPARVTGAIAARALGGPSLGWRLQHTV
jgi:D-alanyl-D-alanine carboxypeptidase (penicillin-binding protein 5/6)